MKTKIFSIIVTIAVIGALVFLGPAQALILSITASDNSVFQGEEVEFNTGVEIESGDEVDEDDYIILELRGPEAATCRFSVFGEKLSACPGLNVTLISSPNASGYGYGYLFTSGKFEYKIEWDTTMYKPWIYKTKLIAVIDQDEAEKPGPDIIITKRNANIEGCSVRAQGGEFFFMNENLTDGTRVNFNIPIRSSANRGQGNLISQTGKGRFSYRFDFIKVLNVENETITLMTSGDYRSGPGKRVDADAVLLLDKDEEMVDILSEDFSLEDAKVKFLRRC